MEMVWRIRGVATDVRIDWVLYSTSKWSGHTLWLHDAPRLNSVTLSIYGFLGWRNTDR